MMGELYRLDFSNGKSYIGVSKRGAKVRFKEHKRDATVRLINYPVYNAWRKYGEPSLQVIATLDVDLLNSAEIEAIAREKTLSPHGYNTSPGGLLGAMSNPECSKKLIGRYKGRVYKEEWRQKIIASVRAFHASPASEQYRKNMSKLMKGRKLPPLSASTKQLISESKKNLSLETIKRMSDAAKARSPEAARNMVSTRLKRGSYIHSDSTKLKISEALLKNSIKNRVAYATGWARKQNRPFSELKENKNPI
jgi:hypothetical protein